jgi:hypothetical protein
VPPDDVKSVETTGATGDFVLLTGIRETRGALGRWQRDPGSVLIPWFAGGLFVAVGLLVAVWVVSLLSTPDLTGYFIPGVNIPIEPFDFVRILSSNLLVLALHATACVAGFIAGSSLPRAAREMTGFKRFVHEKAGPLAITWVVLVTTFSLFAQAFALGFDASTISSQLGITSWLLIVTVLPHALLELTAVFLPLAAWLMASRRGDWHDLLAATFVTVALAVPMLLVAGMIEILLWPELLLDASTPRPL